MSAMRAGIKGKSQGLLAGLLSLLISFTLLVPVEANAITFNSAPAKFWGHIYASQSSRELIGSNPTSTNLEGDFKSEWRVTYKDFPAEAKAAVQFAVDIWSRNFESEVPINVEANWETNPDDRVLGSARPGYYFNDFPGAPDSDLWYPSALANTLAKRDLDPRQKEIFLSVNSTPLWYTGTDGKPTPRSYDLVSVVLHEIAHGLGFLSNAEYDRFFGTGYMLQPTPFDAYVQLPDGRTFTDFCSRSSDLGKAMLGPLFWSGEYGIAANNGVQPRLYTPSPYQDGSSVTHLDEETFANSLNASAMTPNLEPGEVFRTPGPIALGMISDMLRAPPKRSTNELPAKPVNVRALVGDRYALLTFDSPNCSQVDRIKSYTVTILPGGENRTFDSSPIRISGLKNGRNYKFTIVAENEKGASDPVESNSVRPQKTGAVITVDPFSRVSYLSGVTFRGNPTLVYGDEATRSLKVATYTNKRWRVSTARKGVDVGAISLCKSGSGVKEALHVFYGETTRQDLMHSSLRSGKWRHETVDGNGDDVQDYREELRRKTASDVSVSNACIVTPQALQVFYRDESQGILLGAVKTSNGWVYEIVDGDKSFDGRTTGDVGFKITTFNYNDMTFLLYDVVHAVDAFGNFVARSVRLAIRKSIYVEDWQHQEVIDLPGRITRSNLSFLVESKPEIVIAWVGTSGLQFTKIKPNTFEPTTFPQIIEGVNTSRVGKPSAPMLYSHETFYFGCENRICSHDFALKRTYLLHGSRDSSRGSFLLIDSMERTLITTRGGKLISLIVPK